MASDTVVVDASAVVAVFKREDDAYNLLEPLEAFKKRLISAPNFLEAAIVCEDWAKPAAPTEFDAMVAELRLDIVPPSESQIAIARQAHRRFGKGRGRPAVLNFGDCFAYALAKELDAPLLFKGNDFARTDLRPA